MVLLHRKPSISFKEQIEIFYSEGILFKEKFPENNSIPSNEVHKMNHLRRSPIEVLIVLSIVIKQQSRLAVLISLCCHHILSCWCVDSWHSVEFKIKG